MATVVHGDCPTGADVIAARMAESFAWTVEAYPADWARYGRGAGPIRNQQMVDLGADICLAFPLGTSRGTRDCMRRAGAAGITGSGDLMTRPVARPLLSAHVMGFSAFIPAPLLERRVEELARQGVPTHLVAEVRGTSRAVRAASDEWARWKQVADSVAAAPEIAESGCIGNAARVVA